MLPVISRYCRLALPLPVPLARVPMAVTRPPPLVASELTQYRVVVQQQCAVFGDHQLAVDVAGAAERDRRVEHGAAAAAHVSARPGEVVAQRDVAAAGEIQIEQVVAAAADDRITVQCEATSIERQRAFAGHVQMCRKLVTGLAVGVQPQRAFGRHFDARALVGDEIRDAGCTRVEIQVTVAGRGAQHTGGCDVQRAAVLDVQRVIVVQVERAGDVEPALQELVAGHLRQRRRPAEGGGPGAGHAAGRPDHGAGNIEIAAAAQVGPAQRQRARAGDG